METDTDVARDDTGVDRGVGVKNDDDATTGDELNVPDENTSEDDETTGGKNVVGTKDDRAIDGKTDVDENCVVKNGEEAVEEETKGVVVVRLLDVNVRNRDDDVGTLRDRNEVESVGETVGVALAIEDENSDVSDEETKKTEDEADVD